MVRIRDNIRLIENEHLFSCVHGTNIRELIDYIQKNTLQRVYKTDLSIARLDSWFPIRFEPATSE